MLRYTLVFLALGLSVMTVKGDGKGGTWPKDWPQGLERLRAQSSSVFHHARRETVEHRIPFADRVSFEASWPHFLDLMKSKHSTFVLTRSPSGKSRQFNGVAVVCPVPEVIASKDADVPESQRTVVYVFVDGKIVNLNRIPLPTDVKIRDDRFSLKKGDS